MRLSSVEAIFCEHMYDIRGNIARQLFSYYRKEQEDEEAIYADNYRLIKGRYFLIRT